MGKGHTHIRKRSAIHARPFRFCFFRLVRRRFRPAPAPAPPPPPAPQPLLQIRPDPSLLAHDPRGKLAELCAHHVRDVLARHDQPDAGADGGVDERLLGGEGDGAGGEAD